jgi:hypothetical protein
MKILNVYNVELNEEERLICEEISNESTEAKPILRIIHRDK